MKVISKKEAYALAKDASEIRGYGSWNSTGYQTIAENGDKCLYADIFKHNDNGSDYFAVALSWDESCCDMQYTETGSVDELAELILESAANAFRRRK